MVCYNLILLASLALGASAWSMPFYPVHRAPLEIPRFTRPQRHIILPEPRQLRPHWERPKRERDDYDHDYDRQPQLHWERPKRERDDYDHDYDHDQKTTSRVTGPIHTFIKTDKNANYKWGVRHHVGTKYS